MRCSYSVHEFHHCASLVRHGAGRAYGVQILEAGHGSRLTRLKHKTLKHGFLCARPFDQPFGGVYPGRPVTSQRHSMIDMYRNRQLT